MAALAFVLAQDVAIPPRRPAAQMSVPTNPPGTPPVPLNKQADWYPGDPYPKDAKRENAQGLVGYRLRIDRRGHVADCTVTSSSGWASLDAATCRYAQANARFRPATDPQGKPIDWALSFVMRWKLQNIAERGPKT